MVNAESDGTLRASRTVLLVSGVVSLVISVSMIALAILAILAYNCQFYSPMRLSPLSYMMFLLYFRSSDCQRFIHWTDLGTNSWWQEQPVFPDVTAMALRTYILACLYLAVGVLSMVASILLLISLKREGKSRFSTFGFFVAPFLLVSILMFVLDIVAISLFSVDSVNHSTPMGLMLSLEITNPVFLPSFAEIPGATRTLPSLIMLAAASKMIIVFIVNIAMFVAVVIAGWKVAEGIERHQNLRRIDFKGVANSNPDFSYTRPVAPQTTDSNDDQLNTSL